MKIRNLFPVVVVAALGLLFPDHSFGRGFGGGGARGGFGGGEGARGGFGGADRGGMGGGDRGSFGGGNFGGGDRGSFGGGDRNAFGGDAGRGGQNPFGGFGGQEGGARGDQRNFDGAQGGAPSRSQLNNFLGMPSDEGMSHSGNASGAQGAAFGAAAANRNNPQYSGAQGAAAGAAAANRNDPQYSGAQGAAAGAAAANRNQPQYSGAQGAAFGAAAANRNQPQYSGAQGAAVGYAAGQNSFAGGFGAVSASARYGSATAVRGNFNNYDVYGRGWYGDHPDAWAAAGWADRTAWQPATWSAAGAWCGYASTPPVYYDYGSNVTYQGNDVYVNGNDVGSSADYYSQASTLASDGAAASAPSDGDWLPLGVFALCKNGSKNSDVNIQIAINKQGIVRGNYTDTVTHKTQTIQGSLDKATQRIAFTVGSNTTNIVETGLYNLTKDEAPALIHFGKDRTEQWLLVRLQDNSAQPAQ